MQARETRIPPLGAVVLSAGLGAAALEEVVAGGDGDGVFISMVRPPKENSVDGGGDSKSKNMDSESDC